MDNLSFQIAQGEIVGLLGPNGAGKTTAFYMTIGLIHPDGGQVIFNRQNVTKFPVHRRARMGMGYLLKNLRFSAHLPWKRTLCASWNVSALTQRAEERLEELLAELHLTHLAKKQAQTIIRRGKAGSWKSPVPWSQIPSFLLSG